MSSDPSTWPRAPYPAAPRRGRGDAVHRWDDAAVGRERGLTDADTAPPGLSGFARPSALTSPADPERTPGPVSPAPRPIRSVLFVCTGNVCRSPLAERLLAHRAPHLTIASRGTFSLQGSAMDADMAAELAERGGDAAGFRSRQLTAADLDADLILAMGPEHLDVIGDEVPAARRRAGLLGHVGDLAALVAPPRAGRSHGMSALAAQFDDEDQRSAPPRTLTTADVAAWSRARRTADGTIPDPYRKGRAAAARSAARIDEQLRLLLPVLPSPGGPA